MVWNTPDTPHAPAPSLKTAAKAVDAALRRRVGLPLAMLAGRLRRFGPRRPAMVGAFADRAAALASLPAGQVGTYDDDAVAPVNFEIMSRVRPWDYPVLFWLARLHRTGLSVLDAGGHFGTKYIAFRDLLPVHEMAWTVCDLPAVVRAARAAQAQGAVPAALAFVDDCAAAGPCDLLLCSGLLQYLDSPFPEFVGRLQAPPRHILLNKVATRDGPSLTTLELIGPARVPYQIRNRAAFEAELGALGYAIRDQWEIPSLGHVIDTHPEHGRSVSRGYLLTRAD